MSEAAIRFAPIEPRHYRQHYANLDFIARERRYLGFTQAPDYESSVAHFSGFDGPHALMLLAFVDDDVVGFCDVGQNTREGMTHRGTLGMGLLPAVRGRGFGRPFLTATIEAACAKMPALERIELYVFASNTRAHRLYLNLGFLEEGRKLRARKLDGVYDDEIHMVKWV